MGSLCNFREKKYCRKKNVFFGFLPPTNENKIKILKKSLFRQKFFLYKIAYIILVKGGFVKMPLLLLKTLKNTPFIKFLRKKYKVVIFIVFCYFFIKTMK